MAAFPRAPAVAVRCCRSSLFPTLLTPSVHSSHRSLNRCLISIQHFSNSSIYSRSQKQLPKATQLRLKQLKQQLEDRKVAQKRADEIRAAKRAELQALEEEKEQEYDFVSEPEPERHESAVRHDDSPVISEDTGAQRAAKGVAAAQEPAQSTQTQSLPLHSYSMPETTPEKSDFFGEDIASSISQETYHELTKIMSTDEQTILYRSPKQRWRLGLGCFIVVSVSCLLMSLLAFWINITLDDSSMYTQVLNLLLMGLAAVPALMAYRRRSLYVRQIALLPMQVGNHKLAQLEVQGSGWLPFTKKTVKAPSWEMRISRPMADSVPAAVETMAAQRNRPDLREYYNLQQPFVWVARLWGGVWNEIKLVLISIHMRQLTQLYTQEGNTGPLSSWNIDARGAFWLNDPKAFDFLVEVDPDANKGSFVTRG